MQRAGPSGVMSRRYFLDSPRPQNNVAGIPSDLPRGTSNWPMTANGDSNAQAKELLGGVLDDPHVPLSTEKAQEPPTHVREWFQYLRQRFPLWAFQADEYLKFHSSALPTTYPLAKFVYSMLLDEGVKASVLLDPLPAEVDRRRLDLYDPAGVLRPAWKATHAQRHDHRNAPDRPHPGFLPDRVSVLPLDGSLRGPRFNSFYEELGFDVHPLIDEVRFALNSTARNRAKRDLLEFVEGDLPPKKWTPS